MRSQHRRAVATWGTVGQQHARFTLVAQCSCTAAYAVGRGATAVRDKTVRAADVFFTRVRRAVVVVVAAQGIEVASSPRIATIPRAALGIVACARLRIRIACARPVAGVAVAEVLIRARDSWTPWGVTAARFIDAYLPATTRRAGPGTFVVDRALRDGARHLALALAIARLVARQSLRPTGRAGRREVELAFAATA